MTTQAESDPGPPPLRSPARALGLLVLVWSVPAWLMVFQMQANAFIARSPLYPWRDVVPALVEWYLWVPLTPLVIKLAERLPLGWPPRPLALLGHGLAVALVSCLRGTAYGLASVWLARTTPLGGTAGYVGRISLGWLPVAVMVYGAVVATSHAIGYARRSRQSDLRAARLETRLAQAELEALRGTINPHFLFNALHSVGALVRSHDRTEAVEALSLLSDLLRDLLRTPGVEEATVREELSFVRRYLAIAEIRYRDRLAIEWSVDERALDLRVPRLIVQPLVENAINHGIARDSEAGLVSVGL